MATYVNDLRLKEIGTGESSGTWGSETNTNLELIGEALGFGTEAITTNADTHTTTVADGSTDPGRAMYIKYTGALDSNCTITIAPNTMSRMHFIENATTDSGSSGPYSIIISQGTGANVTIPNGDVKAVYLDGAGSGAAVVDAFASLNVVDLKVEDDLTVTDDVAIGGLATVGGTLGVTGAVTANAGVSIDNITIDGTEIDLSSGDLSIDIAGNLQIDADDNGEVRFLDGGTQFATIKKDGNNALFQSIVADGDFVIQGIDGSSFVSALTLDMSDAGSAYFNNKIGVKQTSPDNNVHIEIDAGGEGILVKGTGDHSALLQFNVNRSNSNRVLGQLLGTWNGTNVCDIQLKTADDTTNKDNGQITFSTSTADNLSEKMRLNDQGKLGVGTTTPQSGIHIAEGGAGNDGGSVLTLSQTGFGSIVNNDDLGSVHFGGVTSGGVGIHNAAKIMVEGDATWASNDYPTRMSFFTTADGASSATERMRINSLGQVLIAHTSAVGSHNEKLGIDCDQASGFGIFVSGDASTGGSSNVTAMRFYDSGSSAGVVGSIIFNDTLTAFNTSSDYRLKENVTYSWDATTRLKQLKPARFNFIKNATQTVDGFLAHEVSSIVPEAVYGEKDAVDGNGDAEYQAIDHSKLVPLLVKTIQELEARITSLES